jgi:hypothetical protein
MMLVVIISKKKLMGPIRLPELEVATRTWGKKNVKRGAGMGNRVKVGKWRN